MGDLHQNPKTMKMILRITVALCFLFLLLVYPSGLFLNRAIASSVPTERVGLLWWEIEADMNRDEKSGNWKDVRKARLKRKTARGETKFLSLCWGDIPFRNASQHDMAGPKGGIQDKANIWVRDADGRISQAAFNSATNRLRVDIPKDLEQNGFYLVGVHLDAGEMDIDSDGAVERIHLSAKRIIKHYKIGGHWGNKRGVSFHDPDKLPLEIGFSDPRFRRDYQRAYRDYEMKVFYQGEPLADTEVGVFSRSGWKKTVRTDSRGEFLITPFGNRKNNVQEQYLYVAVHHDLSKGECHIATLIMNVFTYPEWRSKSGGFLLWTILGTGLLVITVVAGIYLKKKHAREAILKFENQRIEKG